MNYLVVIALATACVTPVARPINLQAEHQERALAYHFINTYGPTK